MIEEKSLTFYELFDKVDIVEIPILQRDYAQGREEESEVRNIFLGSLFDALNTDKGNDKPPLNLDFIYGNTETDTDTEGKNTLSVLDGQQRLTTLFLLHWYLAYNNNQLDKFQAVFVIESQSRFTYKIRPSTTEFFNSLTTIGLDESTKNSDKPLSEQIINQQWFYLSWKQDPTVKASLCMLGAIEEKFKAKTAGMYDNIINTEKRLITFNFMKLDKFGLSDELYIKMNSRGKPLTDFENFKAKLEQKIQSLNDQLPSYTLQSFGEVDRYTYFAHKIDTDWTDTFWLYRDEGKNNFDDKLINFIHLIIVCHKLSFRDKQDVASFFDTGGKIRPLSVRAYEELGCINKELIKFLINAFDLIDNKNCDKKIP